MPQGFQMFPLTRACWTGLGGEPLPIIRGAEARRARYEEFERADERSEHIERAAASHRAVFALLGRMSSSGAIAYLEVESWGGAGSKADAV
ncbi:MAG: hypothetical protein JWM10_143 [Myxococcaceae bacterium]|nr:hypothetical protein [Myxococcaceae bacterium]